MRSIIFVMVVVISATMSYAGFLDGIKKIGGGVAEAVSGAVDATVNVTTSAVQTISVSSTAPDEVKPEVNKPVSTSSTLVSPAAAIETHASKIDRSSAIQNNTSYAKDRADLEKRLLSFRFREDFQSIESMSEKNRIANRVNVAKSNLMKLPHAAEGNAPQQLRRMLDEEAEIIAVVKEVVSKESEERVAREKAVAEARESAARQQADKNAEMIQAMKDTVAMLKKLHDSSELDDFVKWDDENNSRFHGSQYVGHTARERAYNKIRIKGLQDISGYDIIAIDHLPAETLADVPEYMMSVDGRGGISIPKTAKSVESYKAAIGKLLSEEREIVRKKKEVVERAAKERADSEKAERDALAKAHETLANIHAKAAGSPDGYQFKPISIFRNIKLGMTIEEVYNVLEPDSKALDVNMSWLKDVLHVNRSLGYGDNEYVGTDYDKWVGGRGCKIPLKSHILVLRFAYVAGYGEDKQRVLISAELKFRSKDNAPEPSAVCEKYAQIPGVKVSKEKEKYGDRFRDGTSQFWKVIYWKVCKEIKYQKERCQKGMVDSGDETYKAIMAKLEADEKAIRTDIVEDVFREVDVFEVDGMQIRVKPDMETKKASIVTFEDVVMSKWLEKFKAGIDAQKKKAAADAKAAAEKKATAAALEF